MQEPSNLRLLYIFNNRHMESCNQAIVFLSRYVGNLNILIIAMYCILNREHLVLFQAFIIASTASQEEMKRWYAF